MTGFVVARGRRAVARDPPTVSLEGKASLTRKAAGVEEADTALVSIDDPGFGESTAGLTINNVQSGLQDIVVPGREVCERGCGVVSGQYQRDTRNDCFGSPVASNKNKPSLSVRTLSSTASFNFPPIHLT